MYNIVSNNTKDITNVLKVPYFGKVYRFVIGDEVLLIRRKRLTKEVLATMKEENGGPGWVNFMANSMMGGRIHIIDRIDVKRNLFHLTSGFWWTTKFLDMYNIIKRINKEQQDVFVYNAF